MKSRSLIHFFVNDQPVYVTGRDVFRPLAEFLRTTKNLPGTKIVCAEGDCGACTVLLGSPLPKKQSKQLKYQSVNACILPLFRLDGCHVVTVEGLKQKDQLHPVQDALVKHFGSQCGYCTPGFVCALVGMVEDCHDKDQDRPSPKKIKNHLTGNLCRCTGYLQIIEAAQSLKVRSIPRLKLSDESLKSLKSSLSQSVVIREKDFELYLPKTLEEALKIKAKSPGAKVIGGATDFGVFVNKGRDRYVKVLSLQLIQGLNLLRKKARSYEIGSLVTLTQLASELEDSLPEFSQLLNLFASPQIKNIGTLVGNIANGSPIGDTLPILMALDASVVVESIKNKRTIPVADFFKGYREIDLKPNEIITQVHLPIPSSNSHVKAFKVSQRKDLDISSVTFAGYLEMERDRIKDVRLVMGGVAATVVRLKEIEAHWRQKTLSSELLDASLTLLPRAISPRSDLRGSDDFRMRLCQNLMGKFLRSAQGEVE